MTSIAHILTEFHRLGVHLKVEEDRLLFDAPKGIMTDARKAVLREHKDALLQYLRPSRQGEVPSPVAEQRPADIPLSFAQERLWLVAQLAGQEGAYHSPLFLRIQATDDATFLIGALEDLVARHEILRTHFAASQGKAQQVITPPAKLEVPVLDLVGVPQQDQEQRRTQWAKAILSEPFNLEKGPLFKPHLMRLEPSNWVLLVTMHHLITDGWSTGVLTGDFREFLNSRLEQRSAKLPRLPLQYADYALWQRRLTDSELLQNQKRYWLEKLADAPTLMALPTDRPRSLRQSTRGKRHGFRIDADLRQHIQARCGEIGVTPFMFYQAVFVALMAAYSCQNDVVMGTPIANRHHKSLEPLVGMFVNTLVLRHRLNPFESFKNFLKDVRQTSLEAFQNQDYPFEKIVADLRPERSLSHHPIFQVMFHYHRTHDLGRRQGVNTMLMAIDDAVSTKFDLSLSLLESRELNGTFEYSSDLFSEETIHRLADHFSQGLEQAVRQLDQPVWALFQSPEPSLVGQCPEPEQVEPTQEVLLEAIAKQVAAHPDREAIHFFDGSSVQLSYQQWWDWAAHLAARMPPAPAGQTESPVLIFLKPSLPLLPAMLASMMAGRPFVLLDPSNIPIERLRLILKDTGSVSILTKEPLASDIFHAALMDPDSWRHECCPSILSLPKLLPDQLLTIVYTSGSSGAPKGVGVSHRNLAALLSAYEATAPADDWFHQTSVCPIGFDVFLWECFNALTRGGTLHLLAPEVYTLPEKFADYLKTRSIHTAYIPANLLDAVEAACGSQLLALRRLLVGVEPIPQGLLKRYRQRAPECRIVNGYGPAETTVCAAWHLFEDAEHPDMRTPIGKSPLGYQLYLANDPLQSLLPGLPAGLLIGGKGTTRGYVNQPGLTASRFLPNPFATLPGDRIFQTGDLARLDRRGNLVFMGRQDAQVKFRGFRIELSEIEAHARRHPRVQDVCVHVRKEPDAPQMLVAYLVWDPHVSFDAENDPDMRNWLAKSLPRFMLPSHYVALEQLPRTANGKVDAARLPKPQVQTSAAPQLSEDDPTAQILLSYCEDLLNVGAVTLQDNFFDLGGHSLLASQLVSRLSESFARRFTLEDVFRRPILGELSEYIKAGQNQDSTESPYCSDRPARIPLSHAQRRIYFLDKTLRDPSSLVLSFEITLRGGLVPSRLEQALKAVIARHEILRTIFVAEAEGPHQVVLADPEWSLGLSELPENHAEEGANGERAWRERTADHAFNLAKGPLLRAELLRKTADHHLLWLGLHHMIADGWSIGLLAQEVAAHYEALCAGEVPHVPELQLQYADYAIWQDRQLRNQAFDYQLAFWKEQLTPTHAFAHLPLAQASGSPIPGGSETFHWPQNVAELVTQTCKREGVTPFMLLMTALQLLAYVHTRQATQFVGTDIANRNHLNLEPLLGFFINQLVIRGDFSETKTLSEALAEMRDFTLKAFAHQDYPFDLLVEKLNPVRQKETPPFFQMKLVLQNLPETDPQAGGLVFESQPVGTRQAKLPLQINMWLHPARVGGTFTYGPNTYEPAAVARLLRHFRLLLETLCNQPQTRIADLKTLLDQFDREKEREQIDKIRLRSFNRFKKPSLVTDSPGGTP